MKPRRGDAPTEARLPHRSDGGDEAAEDRLRGQEACLDAGDEPVLAEVDATLRPLARALLALAEQLIREEAS
ncbi:MAG TPA: hypothetical protein VJN50_04915 [Actinomycetota bacterium]|nr:hypothetical protein [Actinomycetota bacterium]